MNGKEQGEALGLTFRGRENAISFVSGRRIPTFKGGRAPRVCQTMQVLDPENLSNPKPSAEPNPESYWLLAENGRRFTQSPCLQVLTFTQLWHLLRNISLIQQQARISGFQVCGFWFYGLCLIRCGKVAGHSSVSLRLHIGRHLCTLQAKAGKIVRFAD